MGFIFIQTETFQEQLFMNTMNVCKLPNHYYFKVDLRQNVHEDLDKIHIFILISHFLFPY